MRPNEGIIISFDISGLTNSVWIRYRNEIRKGVEVKLSSDRNGQYVAGDFCRDGQLGFSHIEDIEKARMRIREVFEDLGLSHIYIDVEPFYYSNDDVGIY